MKKRTYENSLPFKRILDKISYNFSAFLMTLSHTMPLYSDPTQPARKGPASKSEPWHENKFWAKGRPKEKNHMKQP